MTHKTSEPLVSNSTLPDAANPLATATGVIRSQPHVTYLPPAALFDVLIEQMEYLIVVFHADSYSRPAQ